MSYPTWLKAQLRALDRPRPEPDLDFYDDLAAMIREASRRGATAGLPRVVEACDIRPGPIGPNLARMILAECLAACPEDTDGPLTASQAAKRLNVSARQVYALCESGELRHTKNPIRIPVDAIGEYQRDGMKAKQPVKLRHLR